MTFLPPRALLSALLFPLVLAGLSLSAQPVERAEVEALRARVRELETQLQRVLQRLDGVSLAPVRNAPAGAEERDSPPPRIVGADLAPPPDDPLVHLHTLVHLDARQFLAGGDRDTLVLRRARLIGTGTVAPRARYRMVADFGGGGAALLDANVSFDLGSGLQLRAGKFKSPLGLEVLHPAHAVAFTERSPASGLLPNRDVGIQVSSPLGGGAMVVEVGVFNGAVDGTHGGNSDSDRYRTLIARTMARPFRHSPVSAWRGLSLGLGGSHGRRGGSDGRPAVYRTPGQETYFSYQPAVRADGPAWRLSPQVDYRHGPFGVFGEYVISAPRLRPAAGADALSLRHHAWQISAGYVLTGEDSTAAGLAPRTDFAPGAGAWGAFEVVGRWSEVDLDGVAFTRRAALEDSTAGIQSLALGLNWHLSRAVRAMFDVYHTRFENPGEPAPARPRRAETVFVSRLQLAF